MVHECKSHDGVTVGLIDSLMTIAQVLTLRLEEDKKRFDKSEEEFAWFSPEIQKALADLSANQDIRNLMYPRDEESCKIIHDAADLLRKQV